MEFPFLLTRTGKIFLSTLFLVFSFFRLNAQGRDTVITNNTAEHLVQKLVGAGVVTLNPVLSCPTLANGVFRLSNSNLGIKGGIILSTGYAASAIGNASQMADFSNSSRGDEDLTALSGQPTYDACKLEFDFVPTGETVKFKYVFGSEEYPSFACTQYNDVFAFYISGPGYATKKNIALIPGTNIPVAINSTAGIIGTSGGKTSICEAMGVGSPFKEYYVNNSVGTTITYNGFTKVFTATAAVTPCATYHLKLAIADAKDHQYDSGVFIEEGSLSSNTISVSLKDNLQTPVPYCVRACKNGSFIFKRKYSSSLPLAVHYLIAGTAVNGKDYKQIPDSIVIPAYDTVAVRTIMPVSMPATGPKTVKLYIYSPFKCNSIKSFMDSSELAIYDSLYTSISTADTLVCTGRSVQFHVIGDDQLTYAWSPSSGLNNSGIKKPLATPTESTDYQLTTSFLSCPPIHNHVKVELPGGHITLAANSPCLGAKLNLASNKFTGATYAWKGPKGFTSALQNPSVPDVSITDSGAYSLTVYYPGCNFKGTIHVKINSSAGIRHQPHNDTICSGTDATFSTTAFGQDVKYQWQENNGSGFADVFNVGKYTGTNTASLKIYGAGISMNGYTYRCTISGGCASSVTSEPATLYVNELPAITSQSASKTICTGASTDLSVTVRGSNMKYQWQISNGGEFTNLRNSSAYATATTNTLSLSNVNASMSGYIYRCAVTGACSSYVFSKPDTLIVNASALISKQPQNETICTGENAAFYVNATGTKINYQWKVDKGNGFEIVTDNAIYSGANSNKLSIANANETMNAWQYKCIISGACEPAAESTVAILNVNTAPVITKAPSNSAICIGGHAAFSVTARGGNLSYRWSVNSGDGFIPLTNGTLYNGVAGNTLTVTRASAFMSGYQYQCVISGNCMPPATTSPVTLTIDSLPFISAQPTNKTICTGSNASFSVNVKGADLSYQWQMSTGSIFTSLADTAHYSGANTNMLIITDANADLNGNQYKCLISSACSRPVSSRIANLTVNITPSISKQPRNTTFCLGGNASFSLAANGTGITYQWQVDTGAGFTDLVNKGIYSGANTNSLTIKSTTALMSGYKYRCALSNACESKAFSNTVTLTINTWPSIKAKGNSLYIGDYKSYQWYLNNVPIKGATSSSYTVTQNGAYSVFVTDDNGCIDISPQYIVNYAGTENTGSPNEEIKIYPNPATSIVHFDAPIKVSVSISNSHGKVLMHKENAKVMDISKLPNGVYIIQVYDESKKLLKTDKLLKSNY